MSDKLEAYRIAADWKKSGIPKGRTNPHRPIDATFSKDLVLESIQKARLTNNEASKIIELLTQKGFVNVRVIKKNSGDVSLVSF